jgi:phosphoglycerate dehydrogenase-like enzyme
MRIMIPDLGYPEPDLEREEAGPEFTIDSFQWQPGLETEIPDESWRACHALVLYEKVQITPDITPLLENCRIVVRAGVGFDNVDRQWFGEHRIPVCNVPDYGTMDVAEHAIGMMLGLTRGIVEHDGRLHDDPIGEWMFHTPPLKRRLLGRRLGIVGLGRIGTATAMRARGFGLDVWFHDPYLRPGIELGLGFGRAASLEELLAGSDIVSLHTPLTEETRSMINAETLVTAKKGMILINTGRGETVVLDDLHEALKSGRVDGAGLDVQDVEPPRPDHPLIAAWCKREPWLHGRLVMTPHSAFHSPESIATLRTKSIRTAANYLRDGTLVNCVNGEFLKP